MGRIHRLTAAKVAALRTRGLHNDGGCLCFRVAPGGSRGWIFRYTRDGRRHDMGLGPFPQYTLAEAREKAAEIRRMLARGVDPIGALQASRTTSSSSATFDQCAAAYVAAHEASWRSVRHALEWKKTLERYVSPVLGRLPVTSVTTEHVLSVLMPMWQTKRVTASRVRGRIEVVLAYATARGWRTGENVARWENHLDQLLPSTGRNVSHHDTMGYAAIPAFLMRLRMQDNMRARALEFLVYTAARTAEVIGATWDEINPNSGTWVVPASRMKGEREHRVPLSGPALEVVRWAAGIQHSGHVFPGRSGGPLGTTSLRDILRIADGAGTVHGIRSAFRDWCAERTDFPREVAEAALAHAVPNPVEAAYRRSDLFERRRQLMADWAAFCGCVS